MTEDNLNTMSQLYICFGYNTYCVCNKYSTTKIIKNVFFVYKSFPALFQWLESVDWIHVIFFFTKVPTEYLCPVQFFYDLNLCGL